MHLRAARRNGLTWDEIKEVLLQAAIYCGVPAANAAFAIAQTVMDEEGARVSRAVILSAVRTPVGRYGGGAGRRRGPTTWPRSSSREAVERAGVDPAAGRGRLARLREPGRRGQPQRRPDGGAAGRAARSRSRA